MRLALAWLLLATLGAAGTSLGCNGGCSRATGPSADGAASVAAGLVTVPSSMAAGASRPGMVWIPAGVLRAGTPVGTVPRIAAEELPGTEIALGGFYIDVLPYPDEAGAIPTVNVTREDAAHLCETRGKRLCTELEWERACKGPDNTMYEYGDTYRPSVCDTGVAVELAAKRPSGERQACKSGFGAVDMHGGAWEWTDSTWGRGSSRELGVLRGGNNAAAGELVARCSNALARAPASKAPTMSLRCCAGPRNAATVDLTLATGPSLERSMKTAEFTAPLLASAAARWTGDTTFQFVHAWTWHPVANEELIVASGCAKAAGNPVCGLLVARMSPGEGGLSLESDELAHVDTGFEAAEVAQVGDPQHLRLKGVDAKSAYLRDFTYVYGRIELGDIKR